MILSVDLLEYGVFSFAEDEADYDESNNSLTGYFIHPPDIKLLKQTDEIKIKKKLSFGIKYFIKCDNSDLIESFISRIRHPEMKNPNTKIVALEIIEHNNLDINSTGFDFFVFENDWEMLQGKWEFTLEQGDKVLLRKSFNLTK